MAPAVRPLGIALLLLIAAAAAVRPAAAADRPKECIYVLNEQKMVRLTLPVVTYEAPHFDPKVRDDKKLFAHQPCGAPWNKAKVTEAETPVIVDGTNVTLMSVEGDVCGASPRFVIYDAHNMAAVYQSVTADGTLAPHPMARRVAAAAFVVGRRCDRMPAEFRFAARLSTEMPVKSYASRVDTRNGFTVVPDDVAQEEAFQLQQRRYHAARAQAKEAGDYKSTLGALFVILALGYDGIPKPKP